VTTNNETQDWLDRVQRWVNCCWSFLAQSFFVPSPGAPHDHILSSHDSGSHAYRLLTYWPATELLLAITSTMILGSESHGTYDHILSDGSRSLEMPPTKQITGCWSWLYSIGKDQIENIASHSTSIVACCSCCRNVFTTPLPSNGYFFLFHCFGFQLSCHNISNFTWLYLVPPRNCILQCLNCSVNNECCFL
jgi:hypothetical protein